MPDEARSDHARPDQAGSAAARQPRDGARAAATRLRERLGGDCTLGVVLGTGLGDLVERLGDRRVVTAPDTGWLAPSRATGHAGRVVTGRLGGTRVAVLQGRVHHYEGHTAETLIRGVELLAALGCRTLLLTNAAGGLRPDMAAGELVVLTGHVDLVRRDWTAALGPAPPRRAAGHDYHPALRAVALAAARRAGAVARPGVYCLLSGPSYETRAEYRWLRRAGADVVGMSTVPEVAVARWLGLAVAAVSVVTNVARPDAPAPDRTLAEDVCRAAAAAAAGVGAILEALAAAAAVTRTDPPCRR
ncbi:MAG: purine-nucleoside phosphorylase [Planctomycetia bacterium]|nr:purine-nucleoside phosphorylase [Planctomycetia bacterium]